MVARRRRTEQLGLPSGAAAPTARAVEPDPEPEAAPTANHIGVAQPPCASMSEADVTSALLGNALAALAALAALTDRCDLRCIMLA